MGAWRVLYDVDRDFIRGTVLIYGKDISLHFQRMARRKGSSLMFLASLARQGVCGKLRGCY